MEPKPAEIVHEHVETVKAFKNEWDDLRERFKEKSSELCNDEVFLNKYIKDTFV